MRRRRWRDGPPRTVHAHHPVVVEDHLATELVDGGQGVEAPAVVLRLSSYVTGFLPILPVASTKGTGAFDVLLIRKFPSNGDTERFTYDGTGGKYSISATYHVVPYSESSADDVLKDSIPLPEKANPRTTGIAGSKNYTK